MEEVEIAWTLLLLWETPISHQKSLRKVQSETQQGSTAVKEKEKKMSNNDDIMRRKILGVLRCLHDLTEWGYIEGQGSCALSMKGLGQADAIELEEIEEQEIARILVLLSDPTPVDPQFVKDFTTLYRGYKNRMFDEQKEE